MNGCFNEMSFFNGAPESVEEMLKNVDKWGVPETYPHYAAGWARRNGLRHLSTPSRWRRISAERATAWSIHWPKGIKAKGELRSLFGHVTDIAPTIYEAAKLPALEESQTVFDQTRLKGRASFIHSDKRRCKRNCTTVQYFEMFGNRAIYGDGWYARTIHRTGVGGQKPTRPCREDPWELLQLE
jgi:arylsulfatase